MGSLGHNVAFLRIGAIIPNAKISGNVDVVIIAEYSSRRALIRGSDKAQSAYSCTLLPRNEENGESIKNKKICGTSVGKTHFEAT